MGKKKDREAALRKQRYADLAAGKKVRAPDETELSEKEMKYLLEHTSFSKKDIHEWFQIFRKECPKGHLTRRRMFEIYEDIGMKDPQPLVENLLRIFDKDNDGYIDFREFLIATHLSARGSPEDKLRWQFMLYDRDGGGSIDLKEMTDIFVMLFQADNIGDDANQRLYKLEIREEAIKKAELLFHALDADGDGSLTQDEFVFGCLKDEEVIAQVMVE